MTSILVWRKILSLINATFTLGRMTIAGTVPSDNTEITIHYVDGSILGIVTMICFTRGWGECSPFTLSQALLHEVDNLITSCNKACFWGKKSFFLKNA